MVCPKCGTSSDEQARFCRFCGHSLLSGETEAETRVRAETAADHPPTVHYAGFWRRFLALFIDEIILGAVSLFFSATYLLSVASSPDLESIRVIALGNNIFSFFLHWLYFTLMESSPTRATLGKMAIGIIVTDYEGRRISFLRANGRYFAKFVSAFIFFIGFVMAGLTRKKQALHDMLAETLVIMK